MAGKFSELRKKAAEELGSRQSESYDTKDSSGKFQGFLKTDKEIKTWKCAEGDHLIDVIPYLAGNGNPNPKIKKDSISYVLTINTHDNIGAAGASVVCPLTNYGKPCPVCEEQKRLKDEGLEWDDPLVKALNHKKKTLYNVVVYDTAKEEEKGVQLWITSHWNFERHLVEIARSGRRGGSNVTFADPDTGRSVAFRREGKKATDTKYVGHRFEDRGYIIPDDILDAAYCLEDLIVVLSYDEIAAILGGGSRQESNDAPAERRQRGQRTPEPMPEPEEVPATRMSRNRPEPTPEPEPEQTSRLSRRQKPTPEPEPMPEPDPEEAPADDNCFGVDFEKSDLCQECEEYDNCGAEYARQEKKTSQTPSERLRRPGRR